MKCTRCGKESPAEIHTCTPLALKFADILGCSALQCDVDAAAELRRLHAENEALQQALRTEEAISFRRQLHEVQAENEALRAALQALLEDCEGCQCPPTDPWCPRNRAIAALARTGEKT
jgi:hypothetical protein